MTDNLPPPGLCQLNKCLNTSSGNLRNLFSGTTGNHPGPGRKNNSTNYKRADSAAKSAFSSARRSRASWPGA